jgi:hypothetical protein
MVPTYLPIYLSTQPRTCVCLQSCEWAGLSQPVHQTRANPNRKRNCKVPAPQQSTKQRAQRCVASSSARCYASGHRHRHRQARVTCGKACVRRQRSCVLRKLPAVCHGSACATEACVRACMRACGRAASVRVRILSLVPEQRHRRFLGWVTWCWAGCSVGWEGAMLVLGCEVMSFG